MSSQPTSSNIASTATSVGSSHLPPGPSVVGNPTSATTAMSQDSTQFQALLGLLKGGGKRKKKSKRSKRSKRKTRRTRRKSRRSSRKRRNSRKSRGTLRGGTSGSSIVVPSNHAPYPETAVPGVGSTTTALMQISAQASANSQFDSHVGSGTGSGSGSGTIN